MERQYCGMLVLIGNCTSRIYVILGSNLDCCRNCSKSPNFENVKFAYYLTAVCTWALLSYLL